MNRYIRSCAILFVLSCAAWAVPQKHEDDQQQLNQEARITMAQAEKMALAKESGKIKSKELERENGKLIYSFDIKTKSGIHEVNVDAISGDIVEDKVESAASEAKEKQQDKKDPWSEKSPMDNRPH